MVGYVLIEWDADKSLSVIPLSRLLSRKNTRVTQKWGAKVYAGVILEEGGEYVLLLGFTKIMCLPYNYLCT